MRITSSDIPPYKESGSLSLLKEPVDEELLRKTLSESMETDDFKILAIDDDQDNLMVLKAVLSDRLSEYRLLTALDGPTGIELALAEDPVVILLDIVMPGMDGFAVCRKLKNDERLQTIPVLFLTALGTDRDCRFKALEAGADGFLAKPIDEIELIAQIRAMAKVKAASLRQRLEKEYLTALVAKRTQELEHELAKRTRVEEALRESEEKMEAVGQLAGRVAHDFNNIMQVIKGNAQLQSMFNSQRGLDCEYVEEIIQAVERGASLTRSLLAVSREQPLGLTSQPTPKRQSD
jgi:response regulator RpfG family c-di-GMP phosphodiesterase